ncbi:flagellin lysine-N-methylase [Anaerovorax odorimutans]|uniref:flagellin lysine-N-methylase n=1 Tax=Anaerovorax odorimutans TaxID=109327 RepID=UPI00041EAFC9|nr:flagellin lysine-N-methylase [Anaerovorax odorimutans]
MDTIMLKPSYYDSFSCLGDKCKFTCCQVWDIYLTKNEYTHIKNLRKPKELEELTSKTFYRIKKGETKKKYAFVKFDENKLCPLLTKGKFCSLQLSCGHKSLPYTCRAFPRCTTINSIKDNMSEQHLSLGCEAVLKIIMKLQGGITFESYDKNYSNMDLDHINHLITSSHAETRPVFNYAWDIKTLGCDILQNRRFSLEDRMLLMGMAFQSIDKLEKSKNENEIPAFLNKFSTMMEDSSLLKSFENIQGNSYFKSMNAIAFLDFLNIKQNMTKFINDIFNNLGIIKNKENVTGEKPEVDTDEFIIKFEKELSFDESKYMEASKRFDEFFKGRKYIWENIMVTYFFYNNQPFFNKDKSIWQNFIFFANIYNLLKFSIMGYLTDESTDDDFIYATTLCSRTLTHSQFLFDIVVNKFEENESDTLAHMAILIK